MQIPEGFEPVKSGTPFVDLVGPFYFKEESNVVAIGLRLDIVTPQTLHTAD